MKKLCLILLILLIKTDEDVQLKTFLDLKQESDQIQNETLNGAKNKTQNGTVQDFRFKQIDKSNASEQFRFRSIFHYVNDVQYTSLDEVPTDQTTKRQIEDSLLFPRKDDNDVNYNQLNANKNLMFFQQNYAQKINRLLFFGYSKQLMEETAKAIAVENKWLFFEIDSSQILLQFMQEKNSLEHVKLENLFQQAAFESADQKQMILTDSKNPQAQLIIEKIRDWMLQEMGKYTNMKNEFQNQTGFLRQSDLIVIFTTVKPYKTNEIVLQKMVKKAIFFDFPKLKQLKVVIASELQKIELQYKEIDFIQKNKLSINDQDEDEDENQDNQDYDNQQNYNQQNYNQQNYDQQDYEYRFKQIQNKNKDYRFKQIQNNDQNNDLKTQVQKDQQLINQVLNNKQGSSFLQRNMQMHNQQQQQYEDEEEEEEQNEYQENEDQKKDNQKCDKFIKKYTKSSDDYKLIKKGEFQILVQRQSGHLNNNILMGEDNVLAISGQQICIIFDNDFDSYLSDRALPIKSSSHSRFKRHFDKSGFLEEDIKHILRIAIHLQLQKCQQQEQAQTLLGKKLQVNDVKDFVLTEKELKEGFNNYQTIVNLKQANRMYEWGGIHNFINQKINHLSSLFTDILYSNNHKRQDIIKAFPQHSNLFQLLNKINQKNKNHHEIKKQIIQQDQITTDNIQLDHQEIQNITKQNSQNNTKLIVISDITNLNNTKLNKQNNQNIQEKQNVQNIQEKQNIQNVQNIQNIQNDKENIQNIQEKQNVQNVENDKQNEKQKDMIIFQQQIEQQFGQMMQKFDQKLKTMDTLIKKLQNTSEKQNNQKDQQTINGFKLEDFLG